jgi:serine/threonine protein kinase
VDQRWGPNPSETLAAAQRLGDYEIISIAGSGGMGVVYRARQHSLGRLVALKVIREDVARQDDYRERFLREARIAASIDHPNVVSVYEVGNEGGRLFLAMQWVEGEDLRRATAAGRLDADRAVKVVLQIARALSAVHNVGLVHRDVKPANVLLRAPGDEEQALLTDFGVAKASDGSDGLTVSGLVVGTSGYLSPEQIRGGEPGPQSDLYALGCVLFGALTGRPPFEAPNDMALRWAHVHEPRPKPSRVVPELGARYDGFMSMALAVEPAERFATARAFANALQAAHGQHPGAPNVSTPRIEVAAAGAAGATVTALTGGSRAPTLAYPAEPPLAAPPPGKRRSRTPWVIAGVGVLAAVAVGGAAVGGAFSGKSQHYQASAGRRPAKTVGGSSRTVTVTTGSSPSTSSTSTTTVGGSQNAGPAAFASMSPPGGSYTILLPSNWTYQAQGSFGGTWSGPTANMKLTVVTSTCGSCVTTANGGPKPSGAGLPSGTISTVRLDRWALGFEASTADDPYPDNGIDVVTHSGPTPTGYARIDLWLPSAQHSEATKILDSFSLFQSAGTS